jgi:hypothetical protein
VVDASWALANNGDGTFDRWLLFGTTGPQYVTRVLGTAAGAYGGDLPDRRLRGRHPPHQGRRPGDARWSRPAATGESPGADGLA